ncbi:hypothetical protein LUZ60_004323 [Juncus effusus]|nr:hypothetical protein LUZ60_004323 [Juncus effusus]
MAMKKQQPDQQANTDESDLELSKAVAQAWLAHSSYSGLDTKESDAHKGNFKYHPTRFKLEAAKLARQRQDDRPWDFAQSLWDTYEIVAVSKRLEFGLVLDQTAPTLTVPFVSRVESGRYSKRFRESRNSLRKLFHRSSSKRVESG